MNTQLLNEVSESALAGKLNFGEIVGKLMGEGVESYRADYVRKETTYYMPNGEFHVVPMKFKNHPLAQEFSAEGIQAAIKASQRQELKYIDFIPRSLDAGVANYVVFIHGKKVVYFGRKGEMHTEPFPQPK
jgi:uncharacterized protein YbcV (DUF1398 family)